MPAIHGRTPQIGAHNVMRALVGVRDPARHLPHLRSLVQEGQHHRFIITRLNIQPLPSNCFAIQPRRRARFQTPALQPQPRQPMRQTDGSYIPFTPTRPMLIAHMDDPVQEGAGRQNHGGGRQTRAIQQFNARDAAVGPIDQVHHFAFDNL